LARAPTSIYVTDPEQDRLLRESSLGRRWAPRGRSRCDAAGLPRVESIVFEPARAGRYRVGVDHAQTCESGGGAAEPFWLRIESEERRAR
jgi:hypothetical protein